MVDDEQRAVLDDSPSLQTAAVAVGIHSNDSKGGRTWLGNFRVEST